MGFWFWFWIFVGIALGALAIYAYILWDLVARAKSLRAPVKRLEAIRDKLQAAQEKAAEIPKLVSALEQTEEAVIKRRKGVEKANRQRKEDRQRRLVSRLKDIEYDESRLL